MSDSKRSQKGSLFKASPVQLLSLRALTMSIILVKQGLKKLRWTTGSEASNSMDDLDVGGTSDGSEPESALVNCDQSAQTAKRNYVFAHFMVGNTYPYTIDDWYQDIKLAASQSIDGFVLNVGVEDWQRQRSLDCFAACKRLPDSTNFKLFFSFDMTSIPGNSADNVQFFRHYLSATYQSPRTFRHPRTNGVVISTFSGENCTFGQGSMEKGWAFLKNELNKIVPICFIPAFFINPSRYSNISAMDGAFNWNGSWPIHLDPGMPRAQIVNAVLDSDTSYIENLKNGQSFMAAVSPWFFTHYGPDSWNKNWIYRSDDWLFVRRWEQLIAQRNHIDFAQIISWNGARFLVFKNIQPDVLSQDYGESHYIGPVKGAQPNSQAWVDGYPHEAWLTLNQYYAKAFQTGTYPPITKDRIFMWARPHPKDVTSCDKVPRPNNWQLTDDTAWVVVFATASSTLAVYTQEGSSAKHTFEVKAGVTKLSFPLQKDGGMMASLLRGNKVVVTCNPVAYRFESRPGVYNFNAYVCMSP
ncbi:hypothetical protein CVT26_003989 [Gymnopilus dilepis]|uniref:Glycoside hydrolase family 71 protein n=1 Tax=Gymnopilus dilepis TaxID=231916 RepID=A0A409YV18_9AGAR|nr:hypothetical protein CVT26_003989 [Gymnopilus dilepis]